MTTSFPTSIATVLTNFWPLAVLLCVGVTSARGVARAEAAAQGTPVLAPDAVLATAVGGLERTQATAEIVAVAGQSFDRARRVVIGAKSAETNATQLTIPTVAPISKGDVLLASFYVRGASTEDDGPARLEFLFEKATDPWTKSTSAGIVTGRDRTAWKTVVLSFVADESYQPGEAMASLRLAFGPQSVEVADFSIVNYGTTKSTEELAALAAARNPLGEASVEVQRDETRQTMRGFGGNFAQPRYGSTAAMDAVGRYNLDNLRVVHARIGIPLNNWAPEKGAYRDEAQAHAALLQMQMMAERGIPITGSVWEGPQWLLPGTPETRRTLPRENYDDCIEAVAQFLVTARDKYNAPVEYFSFNEADWGVNFQFTSAQIAEFIRLAGPRFAALGLKTKFLVGDTANGSSFADYARPLLEDESIAPYLGPLAFHSWDALTAPEAAYTAIAALGQQYNKPVWCTEAGHDAQLWRAPDPWRTWENALRTALAYERSLRLTRATQMDYWTYQDNYPLVNKDGTEPFPVWQVVRQMEQVLPPGARVVGATIDHDELKALPTTGPETGQFSLLLVNPIGAGRVTIGGLPAEAMLVVTQSTDTAQRQTTNTALRTDKMGRVTVDLPARSVVTLAGAAP